MPSSGYPLVIFHGHFPQTFGGFREEPPDSNLKPEYSARFHLPDYNRTVQELAVQHLHPGPQRCAAPHQPRNRNAVPRNQMIRT